MLKIKKLSPRLWAGAGFGTKPASYGVDNRPDIRIMRESHGWTAYIGQRKLFGVNKAELENQLN
jgi:DNA-directed RNA polymerase specialized sigma54-like protein